LIVVDTSAFVAAILSEEDGPGYAAAIVSAAACLVSAVTAYETRVVLGMRYGGGYLETFEEYLADSRVEVVPFDAAQARDAFAAYRRFGKGTGHPAQLNLADCAAYALARLRGLPLLYKGEDFGRTDVLTASLLAPSS
jgi:ribonuclease VapC